MTAQVNHGVSRQPRCLKHTDLRAGLKMILYVHPDLQAHIS